MPYVNVKITQERSAETKGRIDSAHHESVGGRVGEKSADDVCSH